MSRKTAAVVLLTGVLLGSSGSAVAFSKGHVFRLQQGDHAVYGPIDCDAINVPPYSAFNCWRPGSHRGRYQIVYGTDEVTVLRLNNKGVYKEVFTAHP